MEESMPGNRGKERPIRIACVLYGTLKYRGRLLKQIDTLQRAGLTCRLYYGDQGEVRLDKSLYSFPIQVFPSSWNGHPLMQFLRQVKFCWQAAGPIARSDSTHVLCFSLHSLLAGVLAKRRNPKLKVIFDGNDLHLESFLHPFKKLLWKRIQNYCIPRCDVVIQAEANRLKYFQKKHDMEPHKRTYFLLENFPYYVSGEKILEKPHLSPVKVLYVGVLGPDRYTMDLIDIFERLAPQYHLTLVGSGSEEFLEALHRRVREEGINNVTVKDAIPYSEMSNLIQGYHVGLAFYRNDNLNNYYCAPNKVFDYLMNRVCVITNDYPGLKKLIEEREVGRCIQAVTLNEIRSALLDITEGRRWEHIEECLRRQISWENQEAGYLTLFE